MDTVRSSTKSIATMPGRQTNRILESLFDLLYHRQDEWWMQGDAQCGLTELVKHNIHWVAAMVHSIVRLFDQQKIVAG